MYARHLREVGVAFMRGRLDYDPGEGGKGRRGPPRGGGGEFIAVHLRRQDYTTAHPGQCDIYTSFIPSHFLKAWVRGQCDVYRLSAEYIIIVQ